MHYIYWIKKKDHQDILSEGYVGYSNNPERRYEEHKKSNSRLGRVIQKHESNIDLIVVYKFESEKEALLKEKELRPKQRIGWNIAQGGQIPPVLKDKETKEKISNTLKKKCVVPYCDKTHSTESIKKAKETKNRKKYRAYHNPETLEWKMFSTTEEDIPKDWIPGRKPKKCNKTKKRGVDYDCNVKSWSIYKNEDLICITKNLQKWCADNNIGYLARSKTNSIRVLREKRVFSLEKSENNTIIENGLDTNLSSKEYAKNIGKSPSYVCQSLKKGFYETKEYDIYRCELVDSEDK